MLVFKHLIWSRDYCPIEIVQPCRIMWKNRNVFYRGDCKKCILFVYWTRASRMHRRLVRFWSKVGQIGPKWDKSGTFSDKISVGAYLSLCVSLWVFYLYDTSQDILILIIHPVVKKKEKKTHKKNNTNNMNKTNKNTLLVIGQNSIH